MKQRNAAIFLLMRMVLILASLVSFVWWDNVWTRIAVAIIVVFVWLGVEILHVSTLYLLPPPSNVRRIR